MAFIVFFAWFGVFMFFLWWGWFGCWGLVWFFWWWGFWCLAILELWIDGLLGLLLCIGCGGWWGFGCVLIGGGVCGGFCFLFFVMCVFLVGDVGVCWFFCWCLGFFFGFVVFVFVVGAVMWRVIGLLGLRCLGF